MTDVALLVDDEPQLLDWLKEYLESKGLAVDFATNVDAGLKKMKEKSYRVLVLDLNVPASPALLAALQQRGPEHVEYRGFYLAEQARTLGYRDRQVIVYSVHDVDAIRTMARRIGATYCVKGRPRNFKAELDDVLSYDPSTGQRKTGA